MKPPLAAERQVVRQTSSMANDPGTGWRLKKVFVNQFVDLRITGLCLVAIGLAAYLLSTLEPDFSYGVAFAIILVAWIGVAVSTLFDD
jgi:hypothetical protein